MNIKTQNESFSGDESPVANALRRCLKLLREAGSTPEQGYRLLRACGCKRARASRITQVLSLPAAADALLAGSISWREALRQARDAKPGAQN